MTTRQIQVWSAEATLTPENYRFVYPDPWQMSYGTYSMADGKKEFGMEFDVAEISPTKRAQEWFIPWDELGLEGEPALGKRMGFSPGYNDMDPSQHDGNRDSDGNIMHDRLRWINRIGPWDHPSRDGPSDPDVWGNLEMGAMLTK